MGETLCRGHWNDRNLGKVWCTNCTCFWFPPQLMAVWPRHLESPFLSLGASLPATTSSLSAGGLGRSRFSLWLASIRLQVWDMQQGIFPLFLPLRHIPGVLLDSPSAAGLFSVALARLGSFPDVLCRGAHHWCAEMKLCFLFVCGHATWHVGS